MQKGFTTFSFHERGFTPILILVGMLVLAMIAGGAYFFGKSQVAKPQFQNQVAPQVSQSIQKLSEVQEKQSSKLYINYEGGYSFELPKDWFIQTAKETLSSDYKAAKGEASFANKLKEGRIPVGIAVDRQTASGLIAVGSCQYASGCDTWIEEDKFYDTKSPKWQGGSGPCPVTKKIGLSRLGDKKAILIKSEANADAGDCKGEYGIQYNVLLGNTAGEHLTLTFGYNSQNQDNDQMLAKFDQILSTFKFTQ